MKKEGGKPLLNVDNDLQLLAPFKEYLTYIKIFSILFYVFQTERDFCFQFISLLPLGLPFLINPHSHNVNVSNQSYVFPSKYALEFPLNRASQTFSVGILTSLSSPPHDTLPCHHIFFLLLVPLNNRSLHKGLVPNH